MQKDTNALKKANVALKEEVETLRTDLAKLDGQVIILKKEKQILDQKYREALERATKKNQNQDSELVKKIQELQEQLEDAKSKHRKAQEENTIIRQDIEKQKETIAEEKESRKIIEQQLRQFAKVGKEQQVDVVLREFQDSRERKQQEKRELAKTKKELITLQGHMENIMAENRILRTMFQVPDNYGFNLEEIKTGEKKKIEDYKSQVRYLEIEVEELEEERKILRHKLRNALKEKGGDQYLEKMEKESELKKQLLRQVEDLKKELAEARDSKYGGGGDQQASGGGAGLSDLSRESLEKMQKQNEELREQISKLMEMIRSISSGGPMQFGNSGNNAYHQDQNGGAHAKLASGYQYNNSNSNYGNVSEYANHGFPPQPIPGSLGLGDTKEGFSSKFNQKIPVELNELYGESGFDQVQAKHDIAQLQLINLELLKTLQEKEKEYQLHETEIDELKESLTQSLLIQDQLYEQHYASTKKKDDEITDLKNKVSELNENLKFVQTQYDVLEDFRKAIENQDKKFIEQKLSEQTKKMAVLEVNMIKLARKYQTLQEKFDVTQKALTEIEDTHAEKVKYLSKTVQLLYNWKKQAQVDLKLLLEKVKDSVTGAQFRVISGEKAILQDKVSNLQVTVSNLRANEAKAQSVDRKLFDYQEQIRILEEEMVDMQMEGEFLKKRLSDLDPMYNKFLKVFNEMVQKFKNLRKSPIEIFNQYDENQDGLINQTEFQNILNELGITAASQEVEVIFKFMDTDGSGQLEYKEFIKRLRRQGVKIRDAQEQPIYELYESIQKCNMSLREAYDFFDKNQDNSITQSEMQEGFMRLKIQVPKETIEKIFKMADISGDGAITFDEWRSLFETFLRETINQQEFTENFELDWKKQAMLMIEKGIRDQGYQLIDLYKIMDLEENQKITIQEFRNLFSQVGINWEIIKISTLFKDIDIDNSGSIEYNELLHYIKEARRESERLERQRKTAEMAEKLRRDSNTVQQQYQYDMGVQQTAEQKLQLKVATLELREKNLNNRNQMLRKQINKVDKMNAQLQMRLDDLESEIVKINRQFMEEKDKVIRMEEENANSLKGHEAQLLRTQNDKMQIELNELKQALETFQNLYQVAYEQTLVSQMTRAKRENEVEILQQTVRELESGSDDKSLYGKLKHLLMISRWQEGEIKKKYDTIYKESLDFQLKYEDAQSNIRILEESFRNLHEELTQRIKKQELEIAELKGKIIPTLNPYKIEELNNRLSEVFQMKLELEISNRQLREQNIELTFRCEYLEATKLSLEKLKQDFNIQSKSHLEQRLLDLQMKIQEITQAELKSKREALVSREKEEFYQRLNRSYIDQIKSLENQIAEHSIKYAERENYHRTQMEKQLAKFNELSSKYGEAQTKESEGLTDRLRAQHDLKRQAQNSQVTSAQFGNLSKQAPAQNLPPLNTPGDLRPVNQEEVQNLEEAIRALEAQLKYQEGVIKELTMRNNELTAQIDYRNQNEGEILGRQERILAVTKDNLNQVTKNAIAQESEKLTVAAQKTISTLQGLIEDKNDEIDKKDRLIERMRRDFLEDKQKDADEIRRLSNLLFKNNQNLADKMTSNLRLSDNQVIENSAYWGDVGKLLSEKDEKLKQQQVLYETEMREKKALRARFDNLKEEFQALQADLKEEQVRNQTEKLKPEIETLRKLNKKKDIELKKLQGALTDLNKKFAEATESKVDETKNLKTQVIKENQVKLDLQKQLNDAIQDQQKTNESLIKIRDELKKLQQINKNLEEDKKKQADLIEQERKHIEYLEQQLRELGKDVPVRADLQKKEEDLKVQKFLQGNQQESINGLKETVKTLQAQNNKLKQEKNDLLKQKADIFDTNGNIKPQEVYLADLQEGCKLISIWLAQNPQFNLFNSLKLIDKEEKRLNSRKSMGSIKSSAFFDCLAKFSIRFKDNDQEQMEKWLSADKGQINLVKFYYALKGQSEEGSDFHKVAQTDLQGKQIEQPQKLQQSSQSQVQSEQDSKISDKERLIKQKLDQTKLELDKVQKELASSKELVVKLEKELSLKRAQSAKSSQKVAEIQPVDSVPSQIVKDLKALILELEEKNSELSQKIQDNEQFEVQQSKRIEDQKRTITILEEELNKKMIEEFKLKEDLLKETRNQRISELEAQLQEQAKQLAQANEVALDNNGNLVKSRNQIYFDTPEEIYQVIRKLLKQDGVAELLEQIKSFDKLKKGLIPELAFKAVLQKKNIKLKEGDYTMLTQSLSDRYNPKMVDIVRFYYGMNGKIDETNQAHHKSCGEDNFEALSGPSGSKQGAQGTSLADKRDFVELKKQNLELQREISVLTQEKNQLLEIKGSQFDPKGYLKSSASFFLNYKEIIASIRDWLRQNPSFDIFSELKKYDYDRKGLVSSQDFYRGLQVFSVRLYEKDQQTLDKALKDRYGQMDIVKFYYLIKGNLESSECLTENKGQDKINLYKTEDQLEDMRREIKNLNQTIEEEREEKAKNLEELKYLKAEQSNLKQKYDDLMRNKIGNDKLIKEFKEQNDKDAIIVRLKKNLDQVRDKEAEYQFKVQNLEKQVKELVHYKEDFEEVQERYNRRLRELEGEGSKQKDLPSNKQPNQIPMKTLKKPINQLIKK